MTNEDREFDEIAQDYGFSALNAEFLRTYLSRPGHQHTADQITDWEDAVAETLLDLDLLDEQDD